MLIRLDGNNYFEEINQDTKKYLGGSQGGKVFQYDDTNIIKLLHNNNSLTEINTDYFISVINSKLLLAPTRKVFNENGKFTGYISNFINQKKDGITNMKTVTFFENMSTLLEEIHNNLSRNKIGIYDGKNYLVSTDNTIYLSDFDMYKTPYTENYLLYSIKGNYEKYNNNQFDELVYYILEHEILKQLAKSQINKAKHQVETIEDEFSNSLEYVRKKVMKYPTILDYSTSFFQHK